MSDYKMETKCIQGGWKATNGQPRQVPIIQSTTFKYDSSDAMAALFDLEASGYFYSRLQNPTCDLAASKLCEMEGGVAGMLTASGMSAIFLSVFNICSAGDHFISSSAIYGGTYNLFAVTMKKMGIDVTFIDQDAPEAEIVKAIKPNTKLIYAETIANPALSVLDIEKMAKIAHSNGIPLIVDNTFPTPVGCQPFKYGADIVVHATTKYIDGHGSAVGGAIVDSGNFDWSKYAKKYPGLCTSDESYHGITYTKKFGKAAYIVKATAQLMRDFGVSQSPFSAYLVNLGLESLHVRMLRHCENALKVATFLKNHKKVSWVKYPSLPGDKYFELAKKYMPNGTCGVISFGVKGGREEAKKVMEAFTLIDIETHVADARSCCLAPASATHRQLSDEALKKAGIPPEMIRLSVGIENADDLIADIDKALKKI